MTAQPEAAVVTSTPNPPAHATSTDFNPAAWRRRFEQDGYAVLHDALSPDLLTQLRERTERLTDPDQLPAEAAEWVDFEPELLEGRRVVQRVRRPYQADPFFFELARSPELLRLVRPLLGDNLRLHHGKINVKPPRVGSPLEWHQDWAFIPHSNDSLAIVSVLIDNCDAINGPLQLMPGSHLGPLHPHHHDGVFVGAIDPATLALDQARAVTGRAGTVTMHHPMTVHGSGFNRGNRLRRVLFYEYAAADAWPLFYGVEWAEFNARMVCGTPTDEMRLEPVRVRMPYPTASQGQGRIYDQQRQFDKRHFRSADAPDGDSLAADPAIGAATHGV
jgi:ectoine hydroxylase-related dioxygenase (phytanoyl-CoA dioxygenase family)